MKRITRARAVLTISTCALISAAIIVPATGDAEIARPKTRLLHGPLVFHVIGRRAYEASSAARDAVYEVAFKLSDGTSHHRPSDKTDSLSVYGQYRVEGEIVPSQYGPDRFGPPGCLSFALFSRGSDDAIDDGYLASKVAAVKERGIKIGIRPYDVGAAGAVALGKSYTVRPRVVTVRAGFRDRAARTGLRRLGCLGHSAQFPR